MPPVSSRTTSRSVPGDPLPAQRARVDQRLDRLDRAQVGVEAEALAEAEQPLLGTRGVGIGAVPLRAADRAEEDRVAAAAVLEDLVGERRAELVDRGPADEPLLVFEAARRRRGRASPRRRSRARCRRRRGRGCVDRRSGRPSGRARYRPATGEADRLQGGANRNSGYGMGMVAADGWSVPAVRPALAGALEGEPGPTRTEKRCATRNGSPCWSGCLPAV